MHPVLVLVIPLLAACSVPEGDTLAWDTSEDTTTDADGDGWTVDEDCNDQDPDIRPDADEDCLNFVDDDCDGLVDDADPECDDT